MKLRPHHLLCVQGFVGKGYNERFTSNMTAVVMELRECKEVLLEIIFSTDDVCSACPKMINKGVCADDILVKEIDKRVVTYFGITEGHHPCCGLFESVNARITEEIFNDICGKCQWFGLGVCKDRIFNRKFFIDV